MERPQSSRAKKKILGFKEILGRLTGFSIPVFGISWDPPESERKIIYELFVFLEDRRVLYYPEYLESLDWAIDSILEIREELTKAIQRLNDDSKAIPHLKIMRAACRKFLDQTQYFQSRYLRQYDIGVPPAADFFTSLGEIRGTFGFQIAELSAMYGIDLEGAILKIIPVLDEE